MKKIKWILDTGFAGARYEGGFEVPDDTASEEIDAIAMEAILENISWEWWEETMQAIRESEEGSKKDE